MHLTFQFGETDSHDGYHRCNACKTKTMLISSPMNWSVDEEPYRADERIETEVGDNVDIPAEVTGHFCPDCNKITSFSVNQGD
jgi:hypothetical protein